MKKIFRFISILMITVIISTTTAAAYVQPVEAKATLINLAKKAAEAVFAELGKTFAEWSIDSVICNALESELQAMIESEQIVENDDGTITFSEEAIADLRALLDEYFAQEENVPDVAWLPVIPADEFPAGHFYSTTQYYQFRSYADDKGLTYVCAGPSTNYFKVYDLTDYCFYYGYDFSSSYISRFNAVSNDLYNTNSADSTSVYCATSGGVSVDHQTINGSVYMDSGLLAVEGNEKFYALSYNWHNDLDLYMYPYSIRDIVPTRTWSGGKYDSQGFFVCSASLDAHYIPIFEDIAAIKSYMTGQSDYYQLTPTYQGGALTVDPNIDYGKLYDAVSAAMSNSAANGENVTQQLSAMQSAYETTMQEISGTLGDIEDNTEQSNSWLEKIYNNTASIASILIEQFDAMTETINNGFASVVDGLSDVSLGLGEIGDGSGGGSDSGGGSKLSFWDKLGNFFGTTLGGVFDLISIIIMKALDGVGWLADKLIDNLGKALDGVSEIMDRYTKKITENNTLSKLGEAIPPELKDLFTFFFFGVIGAGIIRAAKK